jgi:hypothetical protein
VGSISRIRSKRLLLVQGLRSVRGLVDDRTRGLTVGLAVVGSRWETGRTEAFSDGAFAIAITLLVLDIGIPASEFDDLGSAIVHARPAYLGYAGCIRLSADRRRGGAESARRRG